MPETSFPGGQFLVDLLEGRDFLSKGLVVRAHLLQLIVESGQFAAENGDALLAALFPLREFCRDLLAVFGVECAAAQWAIGVVGTGQGPSLLALVGQFFLFGAALLLPLGDLGIEIAALVLEAIPFFGFGLQLGPLCLQLVDVGF